MEDMWRFRDKPVPLDFDLIQNDQFVLRGQMISAVDLTADGTLHPMNGDSGVDRRLNGGTASLNGISASSTPKGPIAKSGQGLKDLRSLSLRETLALFVSRSVSFLPTH
jgi:ubiquitin-like 1-activating enzyme E1 B